MIKTCPNCGKEVKKNHRTYCNDVCLAEFWKKKNHEKALERIREREKYIHKCLWCKCEINYRKKYCCPECRTIYFSVKTRIGRLFEFDTKKQQAELKKLEELGKNYRFKDPKENAYYGLGEGE
jgi:hypothetical protein